jgi:cyclopropane fatty-acyl-phospholipid synthase-like methyltransferase
MFEKPYSQACENNKAPILAVIREVFSQAVTVWEIGSGTGQHACYFASELPHLIWQATDMAENLPGINAWQDEVQLANLNQPLALDVASLIWPCDGMDAVFTANTLHIMSWRNVEILFERFRTYLNPLARVCIYGPFNYDGNYTCDSNANFDQWLKNHDPLSGIRDFEAVVALAQNAGLSLLKDNAMPANNRLLVLQKSANTFA